MLITRRSGHWLELESEFGNVPKRLPQFSDVSRLSPLGLAGLLML